VVVGSVACGSSSPTSPTSPRADGDASSSPTSQDGGNGGSEHAEAAPSNDSSSPVGGSVLCSPDAGTASSTYSDPAVAMSWMGTNGTFADACDEAGNLTKYSCDVTLICSGGVNPECNDVDTGAVKPWAIDCSGHCANGTCPSRCPTFGDTLTVESVDPAGDVTLVDSVDGRSFACVLSQDMASDGFDCASDVHAGLQSTFSSQGLAGPYCTGADIGSIGLCYPGATSCPGQNCTYACSVAK
jgi:hypothetical protein